MSIENMLVKDRTKEQWLNYCWMRGFEYEQTVSVTLTHIQELVSKEEFDAYAITQQKAMDDFFKGFSDGEIMAIGEELFGIKK